MGSLISPPKAPSQPSVVYVPQASASVNPAPTQEPPTEEETAAQQRRQNLLERNRGRFGTIRTSFRGLLSMADSIAGRKTLLGE